MPVPPSPAASGGNHYLLYELLLKSYVPAPVQVTRVEVFAESPAGPRLLEYAGEELGENMVFPVFIEDDPVRQRTIGARSHGVVYVLVSISRSATVPRQLFHRVWFDLPYQEEWFATPSADSTVVDHVDLATPVYSSAIEIGPPLKGGPWAAFAGLSNDGDHRRIQTQVFGRSVFSQRYAVDYLLVDTEGRAVPVAGGGNDTYPGYGREVIAVADGIVSTAVDGIPANTPGVTTRPEVFNLTTVPGNHVMVDLGERSLCGVRTPHSGKRGGPGRPARAPRRCPWPGREFRQFECSPPPLPARRQQSAAWRRGVAVRARRLRAGGLLSRRPTRSVRDERAGAAAA